MRPPQAGSLYRQPRLAVANPGSARLQEHTKHVTKAPNEAPHPGSSIQRRAYIARRGSRTGSTGRQVRLLAIAVALANAIAEGWEPISPTPVRGPSGYERAAANELTPSAPVETTTGIIANPGSGSVRQVLAPGYRGSFTFQHPLLVEPTRSINPLFCNSAIFRFTVLGETPSRSARRSCVIFPSDFKRSRINRSETFTVSSPPFLVSFSPFLVSFPPFLVPNSPVLVSFSPFLVSNPL